MTTKHTGERFFVCNYVAIADIFWAGSTVRIFIDFIQVENFIILCPLIILHILIVIGAFVNNSFALRIKAFNWLNFFQLMVDMLLKANSTT